MLVDLAENQGSGYVSLRDISARQNISKKYLEQIVPAFNGADILRTNRGYQGGYRLSRQPSDYTVGEILRLTEGSLAPVACLECDPVECKRKDICPTLPVWKGLYKAIADYLDGITLKDLVDGSVDVKKLTE